MNPYEVLGVDRSSTIDEIETSYRRLLRAHHPDLHHAGSPDDLAGAEQRTRELNEAMALIRAGWHPSRAGGPASWPRGAAAASTRRSRSRWEDALHLRDDTDWYRNPWHDGRTSSLVQCPLCLQVFGDRARFRLHLGRDHHLTEDTFVAAPAAPAERLHWLAWVPAPALTFSALLFVYLTIVVHAARRGRGRPRPSGSASSSPRWR